MNYHEECRFSPSAWSTDLHIELQGLSSQAVVGIQGDLPVLHLDKGDHLWYQEKDERLMIGVSEFLAVEIGEVLRVILPQAENEIDEGRDMFSIWTADEKVAFPSMYSGIIAEVNGEVEINPDLVNDSAYDHGWIIIIEPHELDLENLLEPDEYVEFLAEL